MPQHERVSVSSRMLPLALFVVLAAGVYFAKDVLVPLVLAVLLSFLLAPLVHGLERLHLPRIPAVIVVVILAFSCIGGLGFVVAQQVVDLARKVPLYKDNIREKIVALRSPEGGVFDKASETIRELSREIQSTTGTVETTVTLKDGTPAVAEVKSEAETRDPRILRELPPLTRGPAPRPIKREPIPVKIAEGPAGALQFIGAVAGPLLKPFVTAGIVILFVIFIHIQREDLRDRIIRLIGQGNIMLTTEAINDAGRRVSRYLVMQFIVNATYGIPVAIGLYFIGVPNAILWGILAMLLRFIPYAGPWIAASMPILLSLAVFDGWSRPMLTIGMFITLEIISNNFVEPWVYGASTGVTPFALILAAVFWTWLWGAVGLFLSTPLTVCLVVLGRHVPQLAFLNLLMGEEPGLASEERLYQRLLASNEEEARKIAETSLEESDYDLTAVFDGVLIPALSLAELDRHRGVLQEERGLFVFQAIDEIAEDLSEKAARAEEQRRQGAKKESKNGAPDDGKEGEARAAEEPNVAPDLRVACLPAHDEADEVAGGLLARVLEQKGVIAMAADEAELAAEVLGNVERMKAKVVFISAIPPFAVTHARYLCKRVRKRFPDARIIVCLWNAPGDLSNAIRRIRMAGGDKIVRSISEALKEI